MNESAETWFFQRTSTWRDWPLPQVSEAKRRREATVSVVIPAKNEERTVGPVVTAVRDALVRAVPLVDEVVVMDSDSTDATAEVAERAGATVYRCRDIGPALGAHPGKGEALWKSLLVTSGDILVFLDADLTRWGTHFITGLLGPLLNDDGVLLVKACYERLWSAAAESGQAGQAAGGRVTELVARPLLNLWWPELSGVAEPLGGEWAIRRSLLEDLSIPVGYGVELAVLLDTAERFGLDAVAQVDLGERGHRHQPDRDLAVMAAELLVVAGRRRPAAPGSPREDRPATAAELCQFTRVHDRPYPRTRAVPAAERPPVRSLSPGMAR
jgi:glucosyl-3-phosphoglycerate synthase